MNTTTSKIVRFQWCRRLDMVLSLKKDTSTVFEETTIIASVPEHGRGQLADC